jgi:hypothetical protein
LGCGDGGVVDGVCGDMLSGGGCGVATAEVFVCDLEMGFKQNPCFVLRCLLPPLTAVHVEVPTLLYDGVDPALYSGLGGGSRPVVANTTPSSIWR